MNQALPIIFRSWTLFAALVVLSGWFFSFLGQLGLLAYAMPLFLVGILIAGWKSGRGEWRNAWTELKPCLLFWPFLLLLFFIGLVAVLYPPTVHDSLSYRLPRILIWLQNQSIAHVPVADERLNYMPHNWELVALPWFRWFGDRFLELPNLISWLILYLLGLSWARRFARQESLTKWLGLAAASGYLPVLQACRTSNDLFAMVFVLLAVWFFLQARALSSWIDLIFSGLSLALAAGTKPHYCILAPFWVIAFLFFYPWRITWKPLLAVAVPAFIAALLLSPLPSFLMNNATYGDWKGPASEGVMAAGSAFEKIAAGTVMSLHGNLQLPLNPLAEQWNALTKQWADEAGISQRLPKFTLYQVQIPIVDGVGLGICVAFLGGLGVALALRHFREIPPEAWYLSLVGLCGLWIAASQVLPSTIARSFIGFTYMGMPLAFAGLRFASPLFLKGWTLLCLFTACFVLAVTPSNPLWPVGMIKRWLEAHSPVSTASALVTRYASFAERYGVGRELMEQIPPDQPIVAIMGGGEPLLQLWSPYRPLRRVLFLKPGETLPADTALLPEVLLVGGIAFQEHPLLVGRLEKGELPYQLVDEKNYISRLQDGPRPWRLYRRKDPN